MERMTRIGILFLMLGGTGVWACGQEPVSPDVRRGRAVSATPPPDSTTIRLWNAMAAPDRPARDRAQDAYRKPLEVLEFMGIDEDMTVLDVNPDDGYFVELLAAAVGPDGTVYIHDAATPAHRLSKSRAALRDRLANNRLPMVVRSEADLDDPALAQRMDAVFLTLGFNDFYNTHGEQTTIALLEKIAGTLKPDGVLSIVDYVGEQPRSLDNFVVHTSERLKAERALTAAGFLIESESDALKERGFEFQGFAAGELARRQDRFIIRARLDR